MSGLRLPAGGVIDRAQPLAFTWDGRPLQGFAGDSLASALMAAGERVLGRGFKYHRPRGVTSAGVEEGGAVVTIGRGARRVVNVKAPCVALHEGLAATGQNAWPSVRFDLGRVNDLLGRFIGAGFYYKTFMGVTGRGTGEWMRFEALIRRAAGMGAAAREADPDWTEIAHDHCDVLVVGSGPAGLAAAQAARDAGLDVILADQDFALGGDLLGAAGPVGETPAADWRAGALAALRGAARLWPRSTVFGLYDGGMAGVLQRAPDGCADPDQPRERLRVVRAARVIVAAGALERPFAFGDNDLPGVMAAAAARAYAQRYGVLAGRRIVLATAHDGGYADAAALARAGAAVTLTDARAQADAAAAAQAQDAGVEVRAQTVPVQAYGRGGVRGVWLGRHLGEGWAQPTDDVSTDVVAVSGGWSPALHLPAHRKIRPVWSDALCAFLPGETDQPIHVAGAAAGVWDAAGCAASGRAAGLAAARALGAWGGAVANAPAAQGWATPPAPLYEVRVEGRRMKAYVDPQHDVTTADLRQAQDEGFTSVEHVKRYTTLGMATDQGKLGNVVGMGVMAAQRGVTVPEIGTTTFRPPYSPVSIGALAGAGVGERWRPVRRSPLHAPLAEAGAVFTDAGLWKRAWYFAQDGEGLAQAAAREAAMVRATVGVTDVSTLGKIAVQGPDLTAFLHRLYVNGFAKLPPGRARWGVMLREDGMVLDDGTVWRLSEHEAVITTTTAEAGPVMAHVERHLQTRWTSMRVQATSVSDGWAGVAVAGPRSRQTLAAVLPDLDVSHAALPPMAVRVTRFEGAQARVARLSFSGERAFEAFVPADRGPALWAALLAAAQAQGGGAYGLEALDVLRVEKGHLTGREIDGNAALPDLGLDRLGAKKTAYVGAALRRRPGLEDPDRPALVGLRAAPGAMFNAGAVLCAPDAVGGHGLGWVSSIADSPYVGARIGLGFVAGGLAARRGQTLAAADPVRGLETAVTVVDPVFIDPDGRRMDG